MYVAKIVRKVRSLCHVPRTCFWWISQQVWKTEYSCQLNQHSVLTLGRADAEKRCPRVMVADCEAEEIIYSSTPDRESSNFFLLLRKWSKLSTCGNITTKLRQKIKTKYWTWIDFNMSVKNKIFFGKTKKWHRFDSLHVLKAPVSWFNFATTLHSSQLVILQRARMGFKMMHLKNTTLCVWMWANVYKRAFYWVDEKRQELMDKWLCAQIKWRTTEIREAA